MVRPLRYVDRVLNQYIEILIKSAKRKVINHADENFCREYRKGTENATQSAVNGLDTMTRQPVKLYSLSTCSHCKAVKKLLARHNIEFDVVEVDRLEKSQRDDTIAEVKQHNERLSFPTTVIGDEVVVGYKANHIKKLLSGD
jgi:glutaredoxin